MSVTTDQVHKAKRWIRIKIYLLAKAILTFKRRLKPVQIGIEKESLIWMWFSPAKPLIINKLNIMAETALVKM
jgi:hypothetical protein